MATTYLHPQAQNYCITQRNLSYAMRSKDLICIQGAALIIYGLILGDRHITVIDISSKLSVFYPMIGTTKASIGLDFMRLITGIWNGSPAPTPGDGYIDFSGNSNTAMQIFRTAFVPPANQTAYHISYYSKVNIAASFPTMLEIGTTAGSGMLLGMKGTSGTLGNVYNTTNALCLTQDVTRSALSTANAFIISRSDSSTTNFFYTYDATGIFAPAPFHDSPVTSSSTPYAPGQVVLGGNTSGPGGTYSNRSCEGMSAGQYLSQAEAAVLSSAYSSIHTNKQ